MSTREGAIAAWMLDDGRELVVYPLTYGRARLVVGRPNGNFYDDAW